MAAPTPKHAAARTMAPEGGPRPAGIGLPAFRPASRGASTRSLAVPIPSCRRVIASPIRNATSAGPPASAATAPLTMPSSTDGKGCVRRTQPRDRAAKPGARSDVDELAEIRDEVIDEALAPVGDL